MLQRGLNLCQKKQIVHDHQDRWLFHGEVSPCKTHLVKCSYASKTVSLLLEAPHAWCLHRCTAILRSRYMMSLPLCWRKVCMMPLDTPVPSGQRYMRFTDH